MVNITFWRYVVFWVREHRDELLRPGELKAGILIDLVISENVNDTIGIKCVLLSLQVFIVRLTVPLPALNKLPSTDELGM